jgi:propanol-preferring alcohol dehydrogenase
MLAMVLNKMAPIETSPLRATTLPDPIPGASEVRVRVRCCAICRTDLHIIERDLPPAKSPIIPGHQIVGVIDHLGADCRRFRIGQRIGIAWLRHACGQCRFCRRERENLCPYSQYTGYHADGGYAEYAVVPEDFAYEIPEQFTDLQAAPLLCAGIVGYRALERAHLQEDGTLLIIGFGSSAHIVMQVAKRRRCRILVVTRGQAHQQLARSMGADVVCAATDELKEKATSAILFAPAGTLVPKALEALDRGGTLSLAGIHMSTIPALDYDRQLFQERDIHPVTANTRKDGRALLQEAVEAQVHAHVTIYPLTDANRALQDLKEDRMNGTGVLQMEEKPQVR